MRSVRRTALLLLLALTGAACGEAGSSSPLQVKERETPASTSAGGESAPDDPGSAEKDGGVDFTVQTFDGKTFTMSEHRGSPVVLNFWESWCPQCQVEQPDLNQVFERYEGEVAFVGVSNNDTVADGKAYQQEYNVPYPLGHAPDVWEQFKVPYQPVTAVFDGAGEVVGSVDGPISEDALVELIEKALGRSGSGS